MRISKSLGPLALLAACGIFGAATPAAKAQDLTTLWDYCSVRPAPDFYCADGEGPYGTLVQGSDGNFYGTTYSAGSNGGGTFFRLTPGGELTTLYSFCAIITPLYCEDGSGPYSGVVEDGNGVFYGTTISGGFYGPSSYGLYGTIYEMSSAGRLSTIYSFCPQHPNCTDGYDPQAPLILGRDGFLYGSTLYGGSTTLNGGTIFRVGPQGGLTTIYTFCQQVSNAICLDGSTPWGGMVMGTDGNLYGTTVNGGTYGMGVVFKLTTGGTMTTLWSFCSLGSNACTDGANPEGTLIQGSDGNFYGTTLNGGTPQGTGTAFKITSGGTLTTIYRFCALSSCADGANPFGGLVEGTDGNFYGTTGAYAVNYYGNAFQLTPGGTLTTLYNFCSISSGDFLCADGANPHASLIQGIDGNFYGTAANGGTGGSQGQGTAFKLQAFPFGMLSSTSLEFPRQTVNSTSAAQTVTITNTSVGSLSVSGVQTLGTDAADFIPASGCSAPLTSGQNCQITVQFSPKIVGSLSAQLVITDNSSGVTGGTQIVALSGTGYEPAVNSPGPIVPVQPPPPGTVAPGNSVPPPPAPVASFTSVSLVFTSQAVGTNSGSVAVRLNNTGNAPLLISGMVLSGDFSESNNCPSAVAAGGFCTFDVAFKPSATGARSGSLIIIDNNNGIAGSKQTIALNGTGTAGPLIGTPRGVLPPVRETPTSLQRTP